MQSRSVRRTAWEVPMHKQQSTVAFCQDSELGYVRSRTSFAPGAGLMLDEAYRLAHLPLIAPDHPRIIPAREGKFYTMGHHPRAFSLVLPVPWEALVQSDAYRQLEAGLRAAPFAHKIDWSLLERRRDKLHATICGSLAIEETPELDENRRRELTALGPVSVELRGLFSGNINVGRLYLRLYPERRSGVNVLQQIQRTLGRPETDLYLVGIYNFVDDLDPAEASALSAIIDRWWGQSLLRLEADRLWLLGATDDLVLDAAVAETVSLV
jgi:hypothetical protein